MGRDQATAPFRRSRAVGGGDHGASLPKFRIGGKASVESRLPSSRTPWRLGGSGVAPRARGIEEPLIDASQRRLIACPPQTLSFRKAESWGFKRGEQRPLPGRSVQHGVGWLDHSSVGQASRGDAPRGGRRNPSGADGVQVKSRLRQSPDPSVCGLGGPEPISPRRRSCRHAAPRCENDAGGRFTLRPSGDSQRPSRLSAGAATSCATAAGCAVAHRRQVPWRERPASPRARCGVGPSVFSHPRPPASTGRSSTRDPSGKGVERRFEAAAQAFAVHPSLAAAGVAVATAIRRRAFVARRDRAAPSPLLYVDANVSVSHSDHRPGFDEPVQHRTGGSYNRDEKAVPHSRWSMALDLKREASGAAVQRREQAPEPEKGCARASPVVCNTPPGCWP